MRAVQFDNYGGPEVLALRDIAPPVAAPGEVLIDVFAASLNPVDWKIRSGLFAGNTPLASPAVPGRDGAGLVRGVGQGVDSSLVGKRVAFFPPRGIGTWAEQIAVPADIIAVVPEAVSLVDAAAVPLAGTSAYIPLVDVAQVSSGMRALVHAGAGGVGSLGIQIAKVRDAEVYATCSERNADFVTSLGATPIAYDRVPFETQIKDVDVVFDLMGGDVHDRSYRVLKRGGMMVCLMALPFVDRGAEFGVTVKTAAIAPSGAILQALLQMMADGKLRPSVDQTLPITDFRRAHELSQSGHVRGKIVMLLRKPDGTPVA